MISGQTECLLCGGVANLKHNEYPGYQEPLSFKICHCTVCNTSFSLPRADSSSIYENIYRSGDKVPGYGRYWKYAGIVKKVRNPLDYLAENHEDYWSVREALTMYVNDRSTTKILEVGSGLGYLTYSLSKAGYNVTGMDVSQTAVNQAIKNFGENYICTGLFEFAKHSHESFDFVILTEVIEHVGDPLAFIEAIFGILKPGGRAIITTPNKSLYPPEVIWASDLPPVHCWWFSEESMNFIAGKLNAGINFISFRDYYKMNYHLISTRALLENRLPKPFFNSKGALIRKAESKSGLKSSIQSVLIKLPVLNRAAGIMKKQVIKIYGKSRKFLSPDAIVCKERGQIMCSVMLKTQ